MGQFKFWTLIGVVFALAGIGTSISGNGDNEAGVALSTLALGIMVWVAVSIGVRP